MTAVVNLQTFSGNLKNATSLKDIVTGDIIDLTNKGNVVRFIARDVPAMGYKSYIPAEGKVINQASQLKRNQDVIENEYLKITIDRAKGGIGSVIDKRNRT